MKAVAIPVAIVTAVLSTLQAFAICARDVVTKGIAQGLDGLVDKLIYQNLRDLVKFGDGLAASAATVVGFFGWFAGALVDKAVQLMMILTGCSNLDLNLASKAETIIHNMFAVTWKLVAAVGYSAMAVVAAASKLAAFVPAFILATIVCNGENARSYGSELKKSGFGLANVMSALESV